MALHPSTRNEPVASLLARRRDIRGEAVPLILRESAALAGWRPDTGWWAKSCH